MSHEEPDPQFEALLDHLKHSRGFDFRGYKRASLMRRVRKRMHTAGIKDFDDYLDYIEVHPQEFTELFNTILINVTHFFRDKPAWDYLTEEVLPQILSDKNRDAPIRVWSAGCASGEEAYSLAILLAEAIGPAAFHQRVKIYATDVDEEALNEARAAHYSEQDLQPVPEKWRSKYFEPVGDRYLFRPDLRRTIIFGRQDLVQDAPISRLDLLLCRNTLMYFNAEAQSKIIARFHFALNNSGFLFLGKAEMLLTHTNFFDPTDLKHRIFKKAPKVDFRERLIFMTQTGNGDAATHLDKHIRLREAAFESAPIAQVLLNLNGSVGMINAQARALFNLSQQDVGRPFQELELSYRPTELRPFISQAYAERRCIKIPDIQRHFASGHMQQFDIEVIPLQDEKNQLLGMSITFEDVSHRARLQREVEQASGELETAYEELQSSNEELETTNEELQSTNEELETTNEELQSTNEELETMNEELHSTNEELETINSEMLDRSEELNQANAFLQSVLTSIHGGVIVLDLHANVLAWSKGAEELWGLRADEARGQSLLQLDIGLPVEKLSISTFLSGKSDHEEVEIEAINRRGATIHCRVTCTSLVNSRGERQGMVILIESNN